MQLLLLRCLSLQYSPLIDWQGVQDVTLPSAQHTMENQWPILENLSKWRNNFPSFEFLHSSAFIWLNPQQIYIPHQAAHRLLVRSLTSTRLSPLLLSIYLSTHCYFVCSFSLAVASRQCGSCSESRNAEGALRAQFLKGRKGWRGRQERGFFLRWGHEWWLLSEWELSSW